MSIRPNIQIYQTPVDDITNLVDTELISLPDVNVEDTIDVEYIDKIRNQPLPNDIATLTNVELKEDLADLVKLLGQFCREESLFKILTVIEEIHEKLNDKEPHIIKNWVRLLTGIHPKIDNVIKEELPYFKNDYSEVMGTNTISYYADESAIDIFFWTAAPLFTTNEVTFTLEPYRAPSYIRESVRQKLPSDVVEFIQESNRRVQRQFRQNVIYDATITTADVTGSEVAQQRPIGYKLAHGVALNNDWYHQTFRIMNGETNKFWGKHDAIYKLYEPQSNGYFVHLLFNYITPLTPEQEAEKRVALLKDPLGVEETFPRAKTGLQTKIVQNGQRVLDTKRLVNDDAIVPEIL